MLSISKEVMLKPVILTVFSLLATYCYAKLRYKRFKQFAHIPQLPASLLLGHLKTFDDFVRRRTPANRHPDYVFGEMNAALGRPPIMLIDLWPVSYPMALVTDHEIAEQLSRPSKLFPTSAPKSRTFDILVHLIGPQSLISKQDEDWKQLRKRFNPGFAPQHLMTFLPYILEKSTVFLARLDRLATGDSSFPLARLTTDLTFDVIGGVVMDLELDAQREGDRPDDLISLFRQLLETYTDDKADLPWWIVPGTEMKRRRLGRRIDEILRETVRQRFAERKLQSDDVEPRKSVLSISMQGEELSDDMVKATSDQLKTFLFAGHDTTSVLICWVIYELSRNPHALGAVRAELDRLFGPDDVRPDAVRDRLLSPKGDDLVHQMTYTSAVIKETLRLHPPASSVRFAPPGSGFTVTAPSGQQYFLDGLIIYICASIIHRDPAVYGSTVDDFLPERWLEEDSASSVPVSAWRPFERGPRNCIGQELATIEVRVVVALVARRYVFTKVGLGEVSLDDAGQPIPMPNKKCYQVNSELYTTRQVTAKPVDGMMMKVAMIER
ncbi:cytochrome P450 [Thozetella sp. PMI_491]|nr:cytochrome P450 [Thozetella sp. PMI_491]